MIQSHPDAPEGEVRTLPSYLPSTFTLGSIVLCRNTAPLVSFAYSLLSRDIPCRILGRDIGARLIAVVKKMYAANLEDFRSRLSVWREREISVLESQGRSPESIEDQYSCLVFFCESLDENSRSIASLIAKIELMFTDDNGGNESRVTLSTIHKAKGSEFNTVFLLDKNLIPSRYAKLPWQQVQEKNLLYVAITRAMEKLYYISSGCWKEESQQ